MWKASMSETGVGALTESLGMEAAGGQVELMVAELAIFGVVMGIKSLVHHTKEKKSQKQQAQQAQTDADNKAKQDAQDAENARIEEEARLQEQKRIADENAAELARQQHQEMEEQKIQNAVQNVQTGMAMSEYSRESRIRQLEIEYNIDNQPGAIYEIQDDEAMEQRQQQARLGQNGHGQWQYPYNPNAPIPNGGGGNDPNNGGNGGGNGGGGENPQRNNFNYNTNPYYDLISSIAAAIQTQKNNEADKKAEENKDDPVVIDPTDPNNKTNADEIMDNQHLIQQELEASLGALGELQLTEEEMLVQLESIEKMIDDQIPDQVKVDPYSVFSSDVIQF